MSTHDLSFVFRNTQSPGTLVPFMKIVAQKGDIFDIQLINKTLTHPTVGPLFGSYKLQHFVFTCPIRLYNSWLHNNRTGIGMNMAQIKFPKISVNTTGTEAYNPTNPSSLLAYLGYKGMGTKEGARTNHLINAIPYLAYWDIFKNYFANKQEKNAYYIGSARPITSFIITDSEGRTTTVANNKDFQNITINNTSKIQAVVPQGAQQPNWESFWNETYIYRYNLSTGQIMANYNVGTLSNNTQSSTVTLNKTGSLEAGNPQGVMAIVRISNTRQQALNLTSFPLENIDLMRDKILQTPGNTTLAIGTSNLTPYNEAYKANHNNPIQFQLAVKTYDSDIFQNWVNTEWIDGANGINEISAVQITDGKLTMDSLNLAQKVYNMLNRIAVSGGTYRDWLETVYTTGNYMERPETPVFEGGMTQFIEFEEVVSNSATAEQPLGTLAGRGKTTQQRGEGKMHFKVQEPSYIIGIVAITPIIDYSQGNDWDIMDLNTMDDLHKPALDGIGYQDSLNNYRAWWTAKTVDANTYEDTAAGKTVAWINYMTNFNKTFGNFASGESESFMCLNRNYEPNDEQNPTSIEDLTTYIDPSKHNEIFADTDINAMNFWVQTACDIKVRRNISAKQIPNL
ncbi:major capsid protein [Microvirus mar45]|uniref:Major capsid protein n=1 Tax=Microvirus mar45 TaxID=2851180 RepID=A0A8F6AI82_9VIRU|nr:major capsid protein [Microvirus mar45]